MRLKWRSVAVAVISLTLVKKKSARRALFCQRRSGESARSAVISAVSACGNGPTASTEAFSRACCSVRIPGTGMIDEVEGQQVAEYALHQGSTADGQQFPYGVQALQPARHRVGVQ